MKEKHTIIATGDNAGNDLKDQLENINADLNEVIEGKITLIIDPEEDEENNEGEDDDIPCVGKETKEMKTLKLINENPELTADEIKDVGDFPTASGTLAALHRKEVVNRWKDGARYRYEVSDKGRRELDYHEVTDW